MHKMQQQQQHLCEGEMDMQAKLMSCHYYPSKSQAKNFKGLGGQCSNTRLVIITGNATIMGNLSLPSLKGLTAEGICNCWWLVRVPDSQPNRGTAANRLFQGKC